MPLHIADRQIEAKALQASCILGVDIIAAVETALDYYLEHHRTDAVREAHLEEAARLLDELSRRPLPE